MGRPVKLRRICELPRVAEFAPAGECAGVVEMTVDEYEVIRLLDLLGLSQEECAQQMGVARTTVQAISDSARRKVAEALVGAKRLRIGGGAYRLCPSAQGCCGRTCRERGCQGPRCGKNGEGCAFHKNRE